MLLSLHVLLAPFRITNVTVSKAVTQGKPSLRVTWTAPQSDVNISRYVVEYKKNGTTERIQVTRTPYVTTALLGDLPAGTAYNVRVRAQSNDENGEWSDVHTETTYNSEFKCICQFLIVVISHFQRLQGSRSRLSNCILPVTRHSGL